MPAKNHPLLASVRLLALAALLSAWVPAPGTSESDIDRLTTYSVLLGRGAGCGVDVEAMAAAVGRWMDRTFSASEKRIYLVLMMEGMQHHATEQMSGRSPDTCAEVRRALKGLRIP